MLTSDGVIGLRDVAIQVSKLEQYDRVRVSIPFDTYLHLSSGPPAGQVVPQGTGHEAFLEYRSKTRRGIGLNVEPNEQSLTFHGVLQAGRPSCRYW